MLVPISPQVDLNEVRIVQAGTERWYSYRADVSGSDQAPSVIVVVLPPGSTPVPGQAPGTDLGARDPGLAATVVDPATCKMTFCRTFVALQSLPWHTYLLAPDHTHRLDALKSTDGRSFAVIVMLGAGPRAGRVGVTLPPELRHDSSMAGEHLPPLEVRDRFIYSMLLPRSPSKVLVYTGEQRSVSGFTRDHMQFVDFPGGGGDLRVTMRLVPPAIFHGHQGHINFAVEVPPEAPPTMSLLYSPTAVPDPVPDPPAQSMAPPPPRRLSWCAWALVLAAVLALALLAWRMHRAQALSGTVPATPRSGM